MATPDIMIGFGTDDASSLNILSQIIEMCRKALFGVIYVMSKETSSSMFIIISGSLMQFFQILGFAFNRDRKFPLHPQAASALLNILPYFTIAGWKHSSAPTKGGAIFVMALFTVAVVLACAVYVGYSFVQNSFKYMFPLKILRQFAVLITSIGFIPIATIFIQNIRCQIDSATACYSGTDINSLVFLVPLSLLFVVFCFIVQSTYFEDDPCKPSVMGRCHSRAEVIALIMRFLLTAFWELMPAPKYNLFVIVAMAVLTFLCAFVYTWYLPFYRQSICEIKSTLAWMQCWAAIVVAVAQLNDDITDAAPVVAFYIGIPIVIIASNLLLTARKIWIRNTPVQQLSSAFEVQLKVHLLMVKYADAWMDNGKRGTVSEAEFNNICRVSEEIYVEGVKKFSNSSLIFLFRGQFYLSVLKHTHAGMRALAKAVERFPQLDEQFLIYRRRKKRSEDNAGTASNDVITSIAYEQYLKDAIDNDWKAASSQFRFWEEVQIANIKIEDLNEMAADVSRYLDLARQNYQKMLKMAQRSPAALRTYAGFLSDLLNEKESAATILNQAEEARNNVKQGGGKIDEAVQGDEQSAVLLVSVEEGSLGVITKVNDYLCNVVGYTRGELLGKNVSTLVPHPWKLFHHNMIQSFLDSGNVLLTKTFRRLFVEHKDKTLIPCQLIIRENEDNGDAMEFVVIFTLVEDNLDTDLNYAVVASSSSGDAVLGYTPGCKYMFAEPKDIVEQIDLQRWIPFYNDIKSAPGVQIFKASSASATDEIQVPKWGKTGTYAVDFSIDHRNLDGNVYDVMMMVSPSQLFLETFAGQIVRELRSSTDRFDDVREAEIGSLCSDFRKLSNNRRTRIYDLARKNLEGRNGALLVLDAMVKDANSGANNARIASADSVSSHEQSRSENLLEIDHSRASSGSDGNRNHEPASLFGVLRSTGSTKTLYQVHPDRDDADQDAADSDRDFRFLLSNPNSSRPMLQPRLRYIRRVLLLALLLALATVIGSFVFIDYVIVGYNSSSNLLTLASERSFHSLSIVFATQWLLAIAGGIDSTSQLRSAKQILVSSGQGLKNFNRIVQDNQADISSRFLTLEQELSVNLVIPSQGDTRDQLETTSALSATARLADAANQLFNTDIGSISLNDSNVRFIVGIRKGDLLRHLERSINVWREEILNQLDKVETVAAVSALGAVLAQFLLVSALVVPAMQIFMYNQLKGLLVFTQVPSVEIHVLRKRSLKRLKDLRVARSELFATSDHDEFSHDDIHEGTHRDEFQSNHRNLRSLSIRKRSVSLGWKLSLKLFSIPFTILLFIAIVLASIVQGAVIANMGNNVAVRTWSQFRRMKTREALLLLQTWGAPLNGTVSGAADVRLSGAISTLDELNGVDYSLTYGSSDLSLSPIIQDLSLSELEATLFFRDGCLSDFINVTACQAVEQGLLSNGLRVGISQFVTRIRSLIQLLLIGEIPAFDPHFQTNVLVNLRNLEESFLQPALQYGISLINSRLIESINLFQSRYLGIILVFTVFLLLLILTVYEPMVQVLDLQAKHIKTMILCLPDRVLQSITTIDDIFDIDA